MSNEYPGGIRIESCPLESTGGKVWQASLRFYSFLSSDPLFSRSSSSKILELGSGCGWLGLMIAKDLPESSVIMSEQSHFNALDWLNHNISLNPTISNVSAIELDWAHVPDDVVNQRWDVILGCELVYSYEGAKLFVALLKTLLTGSNSVCYYAHSLNRFETVDEMLLSLFQQYELNVEVVFGQHAVEKAPGSFEDLFRELELVIFRITE
jgi:predicted nicotinamide N-methyase